jgi:hypothetical protein
VSLTETIPDHRDIRIQYEASGKNLKPLAAGSPRQVWHEALDNLVRANCLRRFCEIAIADSNLSVIHEDIRQIIAAAPEHESGRESFSESGTTRNDSAESSDVFDRLAVHAREKLVSIAAMVLRSDVTREFILEHNELDHNELERISATELAHKIVFSDEPMSFLFRCVHRSLPKQSSRELAQNICRLVEIIAPLCLSATGLKELRDHLEGESHHAEVGTQFRLIGSSLVGLIKGLPVVLDEEDEWDDLKHRNVPDRNAIASVPHPPEIGGGQSRLDSRIDSRNDFVDVFAEGLTRYLAPYSTEIESVQAALANLADEMKVFVCVLFTEAMAPEELAKLNQAFPELVLMVSTPTSESRQNHIVLDQIKRITDFFTPFAANETK